MIDLRIPATARGSVPGLVDRVLIDDDPVVVGKGATDNQGDDSRHYYRRHYDAGQNPADRFLLPQDQVADIIFAEHPVVSIGRKSEDMAGHGVEGPIVVAKIHRIAACQHDPIDRGGFLGQLLAGRDIFGRITTGEKQSDNQDQRY